MTEKQDTALELLRDVLDLHCDEVSASLTARIHAVINNPPRLEALEELYKSSRSRDSWLREHLAELKDNKERALWESAAIAAASWCEIPHLVANAVLKQWRDNFIKEEPCTPSSSGPKI